MAKTTRTTMAQLQKVIRPVFRAKNQLASVINGGPDDASEYTIDQLAVATKTTVRTIRNYQDKGLLDPPRLQGRKGFYSERHLSRIKLVSGLMDRGFSVTAIKELLEALKNGVGLDEFLGVENALTSPWSDETPQFICFARLQRMFPGIQATNSFKKAQELGVFSLEGTEVRVNSMKLLEVAAKLTENGLPLEQLLEILERTQANVQLVANDFIKLVATHTLEPYGEKTIPPKEDLAEITQLIWELRPLAEKAVNAELSRAMGEAANEFLANKLSMIFSQVAQNESEKE